MIEAINANDENLYSLLKSQWAHRFGVESLEELENLNSNQFDKNTYNLNDRKSDQLQDDLPEGDEAINKNNVTQENEIKSEKISSIKSENNESSEVKSYKITTGVDEKSVVSEQNKGNKKLDHVEVLIPLPPKPRYGYLSKWLLRK